VHVRPSCCGWCKSRIVPTTTTTITGNFVPKLSYYSTGTDVPNIQLHEVHPLKFHQQCLVTFDESSGWFDCLYGPS
jgi:hypothetical protein